MIAKMVNRGCSRRRLLAKVRSFKHWPKKLGKWGSTRQRALLSTACPTSLASDQTKNYERNKYRKFYMKLHEKLLKVRRTFQKESTSKFEQPRIEAW